MLLPFLLSCNDNGDKPAKEEADIEDSTTPELPEQGFVYVKNGILYEPDGNELKVWGINFQTPLSWEYHDRLAKRGVPLTSAALKEVTDNNLDEVERMGVNVIRCHLTPADFTDKDGNIVETVFLDILDYMVVEAGKRNIYVVLSLINHMGQAHVKSSMWTIENRKEWIHNREIVSKSKSYFYQMMQRTNKYSKRKYNSTANIAMWEIVNEPKTYYYWNDVEHTPYYQVFLDWAKLNNKPINTQSYDIYSEELMLNYINEMYDVLREAGAKQPIVWALNWVYHKKWDPWAFKAAAASKVEVVSFCNYPGLDIIESDYWNHPMNLTDTDYSGTFIKEYNDIEGYGWARSEEFAQKAKIIYEFESFYNMSAYLYPILALNFRALGVQSATMWTHTPKEVADYFNEAHFLSLDCTPRKAASFIVAKEIFFDTPLYTSFDTGNPNEQTGKNFAISKSRDLSIFSTTEKLYYSGDITQWKPLTVHNTVKSIMGHGNSQLVSYTGSGVYFIDEKDGELFVTLQPNYRWVSDPWKAEWLTKKVTELDYNTKNAISISLARWGTGSYTIYKIDNNNRQKLLVVDKLQNISLLPGEYVIVPG